MHFPCLGPLPLAPLCKQHGHLRGMNHVHKLTNSHQLHLHIPAVTLLRNIIPENAISFYIRTDSRFNASDISLLELAEPVGNMRVMANCTSISCLHVCADACSTRHTTVECFAAWAPSP